MTDIHTNWWTRMSSGLEYSEDDLAADLKVWWDDQMGNVDDPFADPRPRRQDTIFEVIPVIDSLGVVAALCTIEKYVNFKVPARIIKAGGYRSFEEMLAHLLPQVRTLVLEWRRKEAA
jgi:hypothetical protein